MEREDLQSETSGRHAGSNASGETCGGEDRFTVDERRSSCGAGPDGVCDEAQDRIDGAPWQLVVPTGIAVAHPSLYCPKFGYLVGNVDQVGARGWEAVPYILLAPRATRVPIGDSTSRCRRMPSIAVSASLHRLSRRASHTCSRRSSNRQVESIGRQTFEPKRIFADDSSESRISGGPGSLVLFFPDT